MNLHAVFQVQLDLMQRTNNMLAKQDTPQKSAGWTAERAEP